MIPPPPRPTLFPYTTLFRSDVRQLLEEMHTAEDVLPLCHKAAQVTRKLEGMGKPVVAAVNGVALGGGNEFQMAAHYRVAETDRKSTRLNSSHSSISYAVFCL